MITPPRTEYEIGEIVKHPTEEDSVIAILWSDFWYTMQPYDYSEIVKYDFSTGVTVNLLHFSNAVFQPHALRYFNGKLYISGINYEIPGGLAAIRIYETTSWTLVDTLNFDELWVTRSIGVENDNTIFAFDSVIDKLGRLNIVSKWEKSGSSWTRTLSFCIDGVDFWVGNMFALEADRNGSVFVSGGNTWWGTGNRIIKYDSVTGENLGVVFDDPTGYYSTPIFMLYCEE